MPDADGYNAAEKIQVLFALDIADELPLGVIDHQRVFVVSGGTVEDIFPFLADNFVFGHSG
jgi:hypothetical protein